MQRAALGLDHPGADRDAPGAADRDHRAERQLGQRDVGGQPAGCVREDVLEGEHVTEGGAELEHGGHRYPGAVDVLGLLDRVAEPGHRKGQPADQDGEHAGGDDPATQRPRGFGRWELAMARPGHCEGRPA